MVTSILLRAASRMWGQEERTQPLLYVPDSCVQSSTVGLCRSKSSRGRAFLSDLYFHSDVELC